jgi:hypothetical protein
MSALVINVIQNNKIAVEYISGVLNKGLCKCYALNLGLDEELYYDIIAVKISDLFIRTLKRFRETGLETIWKTLDEMYYTNWV